MQTQRHVMKGLRFGFAKGILENQFPTDGETTLPAASTFGPVKSSKHHYLKILLGDVSWLEKNMTEPLWNSELSGTLTVYPQATCGNPS